MAELKDFDPTKVENTFEPLPEGPYIASVSSSSLETTKKGDGTYIKLGLDILDGKFKGRKIWWNLNYTNPNPKAQNIGRAELKGLYAALNLLNADGTSKIKDTIGLHNIPFTVHLKVEPAKDNFPAGNRVKKCEPKAAFVAPPAGGTAPWAKS